MSASHPATTYRLPVEAAGSRSPGWWAMIMVIATEGTLFAALIASYFYLRSSNPEWPPAGIEAPELLPWPVIATILLVGSIIPMWWADYGIRHGRQWQLRIGLALGFILGAIFIGITFYEYVNESFAFSQNAYTSLFYTITGLHAAHVISVLLMGALIQVRAWLGHFTARRRLAVEVVVIYSHFVDIVWIVIFLVVYVSPHVL